MRRAAVWLLLVIGALPLALGCKRESDPAPGKPQVAPADAKPHTSFAGGINNQGMVVGGSDTSGGVEHAFLWTPGDPAAGVDPRLEDLAAIDGTELGASQARDINDGGVVVGWVGRSRYQEPFACDPTTRKMRLLPSLWPGADTYAAGINGQGLVVGTSNFTPVLWDLSREPPVIVDLLPKGGAADHGSRAYAISERGEVVGWGSDLDHSSRPFLCVWDRDKRTSRSVPIEAENLGPQGINDRGDVASGYGRAKVWRQGEKKAVELPSLADTFLSWANDINNDRVVVGCSETEKGVTQACEWRPAGGSGAGGWEVHPLPGLAGPECASAANAVNDKGRIAGMSEITPGSKVTHACVWERDAKGEWTVRDLGTLP